MARGNDILDEAIHTALRMGRTGRDWRWSLGAFTELWLSGQEELDSHGQTYMTWWVRWVGRDGNPLESHYCPHIVMVPAAVGQILDKAGIKL